MSDLEIHEAGATLKLPPVMAKRPVLTDAESTIPLGLYVNDIPKNATIYQVRMSTQGAVLHYFIKKMAQNLNIAEHTFIHALGKDHTAALDFLLINYEEYFGKWFDSLCTDQSFTAKDFLNNYYDNPEVAFNASIIALGEAPTTYFTSLQDAFLARFPVEKIEGITENAAINAVPSIESAVH